jgi:hypothetical protein
VDFGQQAITRSVRFDKCVTHAFDAFADRREVDRHFVRKGATELSIGRRWPLDGNPRVIDAPVLFHALEGSTAQRYGVPGTGAESTRRV